MSNDIIQAIGRLRRAQPRNPDTNLVCDHLERALKLLKQLANEKMQQVEIINKVECPTCEARKATTRARVDRFRKRRQERANA